MSAYKYISIVYNMCLPLNFPIKNIKLYRKGLLYKNNDTSKNKMFIISLKLQFYEEA